MMGEARQYQSYPVDQTGTLQRPLTRGLMLPTTQYSYQNWVVTPDGKYGIFAPNPINGTPSYGSAEGMYTWAMKIPPPPGIDTTNRMGFVNFPIVTSGAIGDVVEAKFGYGEEANPANFNCVSRQETCWTTATPTKADPFRFAGETASPNICSGTPVACQVNIPAIAGRILFYEFCRTPLGGSRKCEPIQAQAIP
jgi:hypothetical protein